MYPFEKNNPTRHQHFSLNLFCRSQLTFPDQQQMRRSIAALAAASLSFSFADCAPIDARRQAAIAINHELKATNKTVHWGYFSKKVAPALTIKSGDTVKVEMVSVSTLQPPPPCCAKQVVRTQLTPQPSTSQHHAGDHPGLMITGDPGIEGIFKWGPTGPGTTHEVSFACSFLFTGPGTTHVLVDQPRRLALCSSTSSLHDGNGSFAVTLSADGNARNDWIWRRSARPHRTYFR